MNQEIKLKHRIYNFLFGWIVNIIYPEYCRPKYNYMSSLYILINYGIPQKIFRINGKVPWPVHFTSTVDHINIKKGIMCDPGDSPNCFISSTSGIEFGNNVEIAPGCKIISSNHNFENYSKLTITKPIKIGSNVWIGANSVILPEVEIGNNVIIGAGSVVTKSIPSNSIAVGNPCKVIKAKEEYQQDLTKIVFNRKISEKYFEDEKM